MRMSDHLERTPLPRPEQPRRQDYERLQKIDWTRLDCLSSRRAFYRIAVQLIWPLLSLLALLERHCRPVRTPEELVRGRLELLLTGN